jgi:nucleoside-diphosphate-sugar epimerase
MKRVLVTGATGFVGRSVCEALTEVGCLVRAALHTDLPLPVHVAEAVLVGGIGERTDWEQALRGIDAVVHLAAKAHVVRGLPAAAAAALYAVNALGTQRLVQAAAKAGVRRFLYLSSVKVNGEGRVDRPYGRDDVPDPQDAYGRSKWQGEQFVTSLPADAAPERVIVRAPLVYGPGVRAHFLRLMQWVEAGWPLPLGAVRNARSMISVANLAHMLVHVLNRATAVGGTWMASDGRDLSTPELILLIASAMQRPVRLVPVPVSLLRLGGRLLGRAGEINRLCSSLTVDISATRQQLGWSAPLSVAAGIERTVQWYRDEGRTLVA